uniref:Uncharacterized protein n=1 Tax=Aegilops tauschii subsp. strangulata TaxID=200361 RepID=A0A453IS91_AEGTS
KMTTYIAKFSLLCHRLTRDFLRILLCFALVCKTRSNYVLKKLLLGCTDIRYLPVIFICIFSSLVLCISCFALLTSQTWLTLACIQLTGSGLEQFGGSHPLENLLQMDLWPG